MNKKIMMIFMACLLNSTPLVSTIATVNNEPITDADILITSKSFGVSENDALQLLIKNKIILSAAKKYQINASFLEVEDFIKQLAQKNNMSYEAFVNTYKDSIDVIKENAKEEIIKDKLFEFIAQNTTKEVVEDDMLRFYELNKDKMNGATYEQVKSNIKMYLFNENAKEAVQSYMEKEESKAQIKMFR